MTILPLSSAATSADRPATQCGSIDLQKEFDYLISKVASWHLVRRYDNTQKCSCRQDSTDDTADRSCRFCDGAGWPYTEFPSKFYRVEQMTGGAVTSEILASFGPLNEKGRLFLSPSWVELSPSDVIFDIALNIDQTLKMPLQRLGRYDISQVVDLRADRYGAVDYLMAYASEEEFIDA